MRLLAILMGIIQLSFALHALKTGVGFEAKYRLGALLAREGRTREAAELFDFLVTNARRSALASEQEWVKLSRPSSAKVSA